jgi:hypothetical protein
VALFENAMALRARGVPFYFERDLYPLLMKTLDVYWFVCNQKERVRDPLLRSFRSIADVENYASDTGNFQLQGMLEIVEKFEDEFPDIIYEMIELRKQRQTSTIPKDDLPREGVILSTIHSAKGQEYEQVYIDADMADNLDLVVRNDLEHLSDEINVAYVGFTRAMDRLHLPPEFQSLLTPRWQNFLRQTQGTRNVGKLRPGDYVRTSRGPGTVLEIAGKYCLIDLDTQEIKLRERVANIQPY